MQDHLRQCLAIVMAANAEKKGERVVRHGFVGSFQWQRKLVGTGFHKLEFKPLA